MKTIIATMAALMASTPAIAAEWNRIEADGVLTATVILDDINYIETLCDIGINVPITSMGFMVQGNFPAPEKEIEFRFDRDTIISVATDVDGVVASSTAEQAETFDLLLNEFRKRPEVTVRLHNGIRQTFPLKGSQDALADCEADAHKLGAHESAALTLEF